MGLNPEVWLPHLKFTLQTIAITYPKHPNDVSIKKYYDHKSFSKKFLVELNGK